MTLPFEANLLPVAPFALPYAERRAAWAALQRWTPAVVSWPLLPGEAAWALAGAGFPGLAAGRCEVDRLRFDRESEALQLSFLKHDLHASAVPAFAQQLQEILEAGPAQCQALLLALAGPVSLALTLVDEAERPLLHDPVLREAVAQHLRLRASWLEQQVGAVAPATVLCFDEPFWDAVRSPFTNLDEAAALGLAEECLANVQATHGLAPGGQVDWLAILGSSIRVICCQRAQRPALLGCGPALNAYFEQGGTVIWGLVPGDLAERTATSIDALVAEWQRFVGQALDADVLTSRLLAGSLITIDPGLAGATPADADAALEMLAYVARVVRAHYKLT